MSIRTVNPATGATVKTFKEQRSATTNQAIEKAADVWNTWKKYAFPVRAKHLKRVAELLLERKKEYAALITLEMGKPISQSIAEIEKCAWVCDYYADNAKIFLRDDVIKTDADESFVGYEPLGIVLAVMPWNFPFWQVFRFAAPNLMAGNVALLKHASNVPQCAGAIEQLFLEAGCAEGVFTNLYIGSKAVNRVIQHEQVRAVTLTGSEGAGASVAQAAGKEIKKTVLELGGSDAFIVLKEANLKKAAEVAITSRMNNAGQSCIAAKRFIVEKPVQEAFKKLLIKQIEALKVGDPMAEDTQIGPVAREDLLKEIHDQVRQSVKKGAVLESGGEKMKRKGYFYKPTLLSNVKPGMPAFDQEVFGPVAALITAENEEDAIRIANNSRFGLGSAIWTENIDLAMRLARQVEAGSVVVNGMVKSDPRMPFGGVKRSGYGRELSDIGIKEFVNIKAITRYS